MAFEELQERLVSQAKATWEKVEESSLYNQVKDRFENLSPLMQKVVLSVAAAITALFLFSFPLGFYSESDQTLSEFETRRNLTRELLKTARDASQAPPLSGTPDSADLQSRIQSQLENSQLLPEQIRSVQTVALPASMIPQNALAYGMEVSLAKLNLTQVVAIGHQLGMIDSTTTKIKDMEMVPNAQDARYLDVIYRLVTFKITQYQPLFPPEPAKKPRAGGNRRNQNKNTDSESDR